MSKNMAGICENNKKNLRIPSDKGNCFPSCVFNSFPRRSAFHIVTECFNWRGASCYELQATYIAMNSLTTSATNVFSIKTLLRGPSEYISQPSGQCLCLTFSSVVFSSFFSHCFLRFFSFRGFFLSSVVPPYCSPAADFLY